MCEVSDFWNLCASNVELEHRSMRLAYRLRVSQPADGTAGSIAGNRVFGQDTVVWPKLRRRWSDLLQVKSKVFLGGE